MYAVNNETNQQAIDGETSPEPVTPSHKVVVFDDRKEMDMEEIYRLFGVIV